MTLRKAISTQPDAESAYLWLHETIPGPNKLIPVEDVKAWALRQTGLVYALKQTAKGSGQAAVLADTILEAIGVNMPAWDMTNPGNIALMDAAVTAGLVTAAQARELVALGDTTIPRWQSLGLRKPMRWQIEEIYRG
jgi:hypothetical protein